MTTHSVRGASERMQKTVAALAHEFSGVRTGRASGTILERAQRSSGVGSEVGVVGARREDDDAALLEVTDRAAPDKGLRDLSHFNRGLNARIDAHFLERILKRQSIDDRGQHPHIIAADPIHAGCAHGNSTDNIASSNRGRDLDSD